MNSSQKPRPTLQDIADKIGITKMTVSRYLRDPSSVATKTQQKIATEIEATGYIQNRAPTMLSKSSSKAIGILLPSLSNQVFARFTQGIEEITKAHGYETLIAHFGYSELEEEAKVASLLSYQVDGLILTETSHTARTLQMIRTAGIPVVEAMELPQTPIDMAVGLDHHEAAYKIVTQMLKSGKKQIAYFGARLDSRTKLRMQGYTQAVEAMGHKPIYVLTKEHSSFSIGASLLEQALKQHPGLDGAFCTNDDIAVGIMMAAQQKGIEVPKQLSIVGNNALNIGTVMSPALTSIDSPRYEIGKKSAELIISALTGVPSEQKVYDLGYSISAGGSL
ncbi:LacI family DNA-binding transcriptional regulator [Shewanella eurypsychrophilus]|uniref:LacI family DNA-binding transcriptional regulator n=1 Tax=Shewanella eurypsychrophilus TaxID=2593656 RepID=A0ABX6V8Z3_9GAMM|nr:MULTISPECIES: LacI family DNA-binding transcriptional regulator [Shewanella]QFU23183.1 substrate-binding domain-containing protein [Shewanella sp. YLB-09]QPG58466.1 LacI family DNA-binding transcriptional regulator [Shewanella eurypsychrophilus]